jgi:hypothetical protein
MKKIRKYRHILVLPGDASPERNIAKFLHALPDDAEEWTQIKKNYRKQIAFDSFTLKNILKDRKIAKDWFRSQKHHWGTNCGKMIRTWRSHNQEICDQFKEEFLEALKRYN